MTTVADIDVTQDEIDLIREKALFVREETVRLISIAKVGHYASAFSCAEIFAALYYNVLRLRKGEPNWPDRDRFLMGKGHAAVGYYPLLAEWDFFPKELLDGYTRIGNPLGDHPDMKNVPGADFSSGSLGHNLSVGLGMALAGRLNGKDYNTYVLLGDGEQQEGQVWEAAISAAHQKASRLIAIVDRNGYSLDGKVDEVMGIEPLDEKWRAFGWEVHVVDGHDIRALLTVLKQVAADDERETPVVIIAKTVKGKGVGYMESEVGWHLGWLADQDEHDVMEELRANR